MASYDVWNSSIAAYFTTGIAKGSPVFLTVDEDSLFETAQNFIDEPLEKPVDDFLVAVRQKCVRSNRLEMASLKGRASDGLPKCVAFLGALVLAANKMQHDEEAESRNYFLRFGELLLTPPFSPGRPDGFDTGSEVALWEEWNKYLLSLGFKATAVAPDTGPRRYIGYALSQPILRECDKDVLNELFRGEQPHGFDCERLGYWLTRRQFTQRHLKEGFSHTDPGRRWEFYRAAYRVYESEEWKTEEARRDRKRRVPNRIECGLYRVYNRRSDDVLYFVFPKEPRGMRSTALLVERECGLHEKLRRLKDGFFFPLWEQVPFVDAAMQFPITGSPVVQSMVFPRRDYWILVRDPEEGEYGPWATWKPSPDLGERFILLCREGVFDDEMGRLRSSKLLEWGERIPHEGFVEYKHCMVCSFDIKWHKPAASECDDLVEALTPRAKTRVSLAGGLRAPNQNAWIEGHPPVVKIFGFDERYSLVLQQEDGKRLLRWDDIEVQAETPLPSELLTGFYSIAAWASDGSSSGGNRDENKSEAAPDDRTVFRVIGWEEIQTHACPEEVWDSSPVSTGGLRIRGVFLEGD